MDDLAVVFQLSIDNGKLNLLNLSQSLVLAGNHIP